MFNAVMDIAVFCVDNLVDKCTSLIKVIELLERVVLIVRLVAV